jgi:hypothetical protein
MALGRAPESLRASLRRKKSQNLAHDQFSLTRLKEELGVRRAIENDQLLRFKGFLSDAEEALGQSGVWVVGLTRQ